MTCPQCSYRRTTVAVALFLWIGTILLWAVIAYLKAKVWK